VIEGLLFVLPVGTQIDRAPRNQTNVDEWLTLLSTKEAVYRSTDIWNTAGWPPNTSWDKEGGPRFITFSIPDLVWGLVSCNWGRIEVCDSNGAEVLCSHDAQLRAFRNGVWADIWEHCRRADHRGDHVHLPHYR
jgi:hypothetical protein